MENRWRQAGTPSSSGQTRPKPARLSWSGGDPFGEGFEIRRDISRRIYPTAIEQCDDVPRIKRNE